MFQRQWGRSGVFIVNFEQVNVGWVHNVRYPAGIHLFS